MIARRLDPPELVSQLLTEPVDATGPHSYHFAALSRNPHAGSADPCAPTFEGLPGVSHQLLLSAGAILLQSKTIVRSASDQTEFASTYRAYENLPETEKQALDGVKVVHRMEASMRPVFDVIPEADLARWRDMSAVMTHPLVWTHNSGRKSLLVGSHADSVVGRPIPHGRSLLVRLQEWAAQPAFSYRHEWQEGDLVIWDNCGCMHRVVPYDGNSGRRMHRTTIMGEERVAGSSRHV